MKEEERIIKALTDKLVKVAKWPNMRKHFVVGWSIDSNNDHEIHFYKSDPKMSNIEHVMLIYYYLGKLEYTKNEDEVQGIMDRCFELLKQIDDRYDLIRVSIIFYTSLYRYFCKIGDEEKAYESYKSCLFNLTESPMGAEEQDLNEYLTILEQRNDKQQLLDVVNDCKKYIEEKKLEEDDNQDVYTQSVYEYINSKANLIDEEDYFVLTAIMQINDIIELPKRTRIKKGSFDYNYARAENGEKEYQLLVAKAYREGDGVPKNIRLANLWEGFANNKIVE